MIRSYCPYLLLVSYLLISVQAEVLKNNVNDLINKRIEISTDSTNQYSLQVNDSVINNLQINTKKKRKQGLAISTDRADVEIFINKKSYGKHKNLLVELPRGLYRIVGKKDGWFDDFEWGVVGDDWVNKISLAPSRFRIQTFRGIVILQTEGAFISPGLSVELGLRLKKHYVCANVIYIDGNGLNSDQIEGVSLGGGGIKYSRILFEKRFFSTESGAAFGVFTYYKREVSDTLEATVASIGPTSSFTLGINHLKIFMAVDYLIILDSNLNPFNKRNLFLFHQGIIITF